MSLKSVGGSCTSLHVTSFGIFDSSFASEAGIADRMSSVHKAMAECCDRSVSYTHLTLPTILLV